MAIFLAPRSGEQSAENFKKTVEGGYRKSEIQSFLNEADKSVLREKEILYIWGNRPGGRSPWESMINGDYIFFYQKGFITYASRLIHKTHNKALADSLWGTDESGQSWEYVFFADELTPVKIDYSILKDYAGYKAAALVRGFQSYKSDGFDNIIKVFGTIDNFIQTYKIGPTSHQIQALDFISQKEDSETTATDLEMVDEVTRESNIELLLKKLYERNRGLDSVKIDSKITKFKRDYFAVQKLKELYGNKCQVCGFLLPTAEGYYSEVAHVVGLANKGEDNIRNMLVLCPNHHKMLDYGSMEINLKVKEAIIGSKHIRLENRHL